MAPLPVSTTSTSRQRPLTQAQIRENSVLERSSIRLPSVPQDSPPPYEQVGDPNIWASGTNSAVTSGGFIGRRNLPVVPQAQSSADLIENNSPPPYQEIAQGSSENCDQARSQITQQGVPIEENGDPPRSHIRPTSRSISQRPSIPPISVTIEMQERPFDLTRASIVSYPPFNITHNVRNNDETLRPSTLSSFSVQQLLSRRAPASDLEPSEVNIVTDYNMFRRPPQPQRTASLPVRNQEPIPQAAIMQNFSSSSRNNQVHSRPISLNQITTVSRSVVPHSRLTSTRNPSESQIIRPTLKPKGPREPHFRSRTRSWGPVSSTSANHGPSVGYRPLQGSHNSSGNSPSFSGGLNEPATRSSARIRTQSVTVTQSARMSQYEPQHLDTRRNFLVGGAVQARILEPPNSPTRRDCQLCSAFFYGLPNLQRHIAMVHCRHTRRYDYRSYFT